MRSGLPEISTTADDDYTPDAGEWAEDKGRRVAYYCAEFATAMKDRWDVRVYIDLFAGAGKVHARETDKVLLGSPLLALAVRHPFDRYIFCEQARGNLRALKSRVTAMHPQAQVSYIEGDVNASTEAILRAMPTPSKGRRVLGFCFADPFKLKNLKFSTIETLATRYMDFLVHVPAMDPTRAWSRYLKPGNHTVDEFLGTSGWRKDWHQANPKPPPDVFLVRAFAKQMNGLDFKYGGLEDAVSVRSTEKNLLLYRLVFFSKHPLGGKFWRQAKKGTSPQMDMF